MQFAVSTRGVCRGQPLTPCSLRNTKNSPVTRPLITASRVLGSWRVRSAATDERSNNAAETGATPSAPPLDAAPIEVQAAVEAAAAAQTPLATQEPSGSESKAATKPAQAAKAEEQVPPVSTTWMQEVIDELADTSKLGTRGEAWFVAQLVLVLLVVIPPTLWLKHVALKIPPIVVLVSPPMLWLETFIDGLGWLTVLGGLGMMVAGQQSLGSNLTPLPKPRDSNKLVTSGIYKMCRHPMYGGLVLAALGLTLATGSEVRLVLSIVLALVMNEKASYEEKFLEERYGSEYAEYKKRTKKLIPYLF